MAPFDSDQVLRPRKRKWTLYLLLSLGFVAGGLMMLRDPGVDRLMAYLCIFFFGGCAVCFLLLLVPGSSFLRLDRRDSRSARYGAPNRFAGPTSSASEWPSSPRRTDSSVSAIS